MEQENSRFFLLLIYFVLAVYLLPMFLHGNSENELSRWATTVSLVERNSFDISETEVLIGKNNDVIKIGEDSYSKKLPGIAILAAPLYALTRVFIGEPNAENLRISWFVMRFCISTLPLFFLAIWLYQKDIDTFSLAVFLFATPLFIYSLLFFSHVLVAVLLYIAFRLLFDVRNVVFRDCFQAGLFSGFAIICEFPSLIPVVIFALGILFTEKYNRSRRLFFFLLGVLPFLLLLLLYNYILFGNPFSVHYFAEFAFGLPTPYKIYLTLFSPSRGLFFFSPILIFFVFAFFTTRETGTLRKGVKITIIIFSILIMSGFNGTKTDWMFGGKYLIFVLPLMLDSFFDGETEEYPSLWRGFLFTVSFLLCTIPAFTFPFAPPEFSFPHNTFWQPLLFKDLWFTPTLLSVFNLSNNIWTILPAIILLSLIIYFVWRNDKISMTFAVGILSAFLAVGIYMFVPNFEGDSQKNLRKKTIESITTQQKIPTI